jgi:hypothetical protein
VDFTLYSGDIISSCLYECVCDVTGSFIIQTINAQHTLVSYLLVIYYQNVRSYVADVLTIFSNRFGDVALLMFITWMINFCSWSFIIWSFYRVLLK